jgi:hypothetical protein
MGSPQADILWWLLVVLGIDDALEDIALFGWPQDLDELGASAPACERWVTFVRTHFAYGGGSEPATATSVARIGRFSASAESAQTALSSRGTV